MVNRRYIERGPAIIISGSCLDFEKERLKIMDFIGTLELGAHEKGNVECLSVGKKYLGWDFFYLYFDPGFVSILLDVYHDIEKQEAGTIEDRFVIWLDKQFKKKKLRYNLKLSDVPSEQVQGFRLNPDNYRNDDWMERMR